MIVSRNVFFFIAAIHLLAVGTVAAQRRVPKSEYRRIAMLKEGAAQNGKLLFNDENKLLCVRCHSIDGTASKAGPDLFAIGDKFGRGEIIDAVLTPSATIAEGYRTTTITTKSGEEFSGIVKHSTDAEVELMGADGKRVRVPSADIASRQTSDVSLMPEGIEAGLKPEEFNDLIEYLVSLKQPESATMVEHGMPAEIPMLAKPVELRPFVADDLKFEHPVWFGPVPGETNVFLVLEHETGKIWRLEKAAHDRKALFANFGPYQKGTRGVLGMVLHPKFHENRRYFVAQHFVENGKFSTVISEREAGSDLMADSGKPSKLILKFDDAESVHYGGGLQFGPDGFFYAAIGDTGPQEDPNGNAQNTRLMLGKMHRIDVDHRAPGEGYSVPHDNPFVGRADYHPETWAVGFRAPWRFSFDPLTGDLWLGDVGQDRYEEIDIVRRGENYGWNVFEGFERFSNRYRREGENYVPPVFAYGRKFGPSVTGGCVYRGDAHSSFYGVYFFGDFGSKRIFGLTQKDRHLDKIRQLVVAPEPVVAFGQGADGEVYVVGYEGMIYEMVVKDKTFE